jgi:O-antigen/teichoic acid export membrane protein
MLGLFVIATQILSQEEMGQYVLVTTLFAILQPALNFGMRAYLTKEVAKDKNFARNNFYVLLFIQLIIAIILLFLLIGGLFLGNYAEETILLVTLFIPVLFLFGPLNLFDAIFMGLEDAKLSSKFKILLSISLLITGSIGLLLTNDLKALAGSYFLSYLVVTILSFTTLYRRLGELSFQNLDIASAKYNVVQLFPFVAISLLDGVKNRIDVLLLSNLVTLDQLAIYGAAYRVFDGVRTLTTSPFSMAAYPRMSSLNSYVKKKSTIFRDFSMLAGSLGIMVSVILFFSSDLIVEILYPTSYSHSIFIIKILSISIFFDSINAISGRFLFILDKPGIVSLGVFFAAITNIMFNLLLIPSYGIFGAAIATNITYFAYCAYLIIAVRRELKKEDQDIIRDDFSS